MRKINKRILLGASTGILFVIFLYLSIAVNKNKVIEVNSGLRTVMGTFANIIVIANDADTAGKCIEAALDRIKNVDCLMSDYKEDSEISGLNRTGYQKAVKVSKDTFEVIQRSIEFSRLSGGAFDITVGPLVDLWRKAAEANSLPGSEEIAEAVKKTGWQKLILDANEMTVRFSTEGMRIDLGAVAKGYAVDKAVQVIQELGALGAMVDIGGEIRCFGRCPKGRKYWMVGLQDPQHTTEAITGEAILMVMKLEDAAIATSGNYRRFFSIKNDAFSHIIDVNTGTSAGALSSVTVIAQNATDADALATAVSVMGAERGLALIEKLPGIEAVLVTSAPQYKIIKTSGADKYIK